MLSNFARLALSTKNDLAPATPPSPSIGDLVYLCRETGACNDSNLCEVAIGVPVSNYPVGSYITVTVTTAGGASVVVTDSNPAHAEILFSNEGSTSNFVGFNIYLRDSGGTIIATKAAGLSNASAQIQAEFAALDPCPQPPYLTISPDVIIEKTFDAQTFNIQVISNTSWTVSDTASWILLSVVGNSPGNLSKTGNGTISCTLLENTGTLPRSGYVNVTTNFVSPTILETLQIIQQPDPGSGGGIA